MKKVIISLFIVVIFLSASIAQKEGDTWVIGYYSGGDHDFSVMHLDFGTLNMHIEYHFQEKQSIRGTAATVCDKDGKAILWTNGMAVYGKNGVHVADSISYDEDPFGYWNYFGAPIGFPYFDEALILPFPNHPNQYSVINVFKENHPTSVYQTTKYLETRVLYDGNTSYTLLFRDSLIEPYIHWYSGPIVATRHANGRDWWVTAFQSDSSHYYSFLFDPSGFHLDHIGDFGENIKDGIGQAVFSSHGNFVVRASGILDEFENPLMALTLYRFDRCTGDFGLLKTIIFEGGVLTGAAFSLSEQYLYADSNVKLYQWDLLAEDIDASKTLVDTYDGFIQPGWFGTHFAPMMLTPDGRIYIVPPSASSEFMHVIDRPDLPADQCRFRQHFINLTKPNARSTPNIPNYRLGPLDGSPCDTLGLNNHPVSRWRYEEDQPGYLFDIRFTDLSFYDPQVWSWDFDDGSFSSEQSPVHTFEPGLYHVCLTVSNAYDSDSTCRWVEILPTSTQEVDPSSTDVSIAPNPFTNEVHLLSKTGTYRSVEMQWYDMHGRLILDEPSLIIPSKLFMPSLSPGMFLCTIKEQDGTVYSFKVMKQ